MTSVAASSSSPSSSSIVVLHIDTSDMRPILKEAFGKNVEIATISNNGSIPAKYFYEGLQNYIEGIVANHGGGGDDDEDAQRTADGVTAIKKNIGIILKEILNDNLRTALTPFDRDGDGTIDAEELQQAAKDHQTVLMSRKILAWFSFALFLFMIIVCGGLSVGIYYIVFSMKDTYVNPSSGLMMVKAPDGSIDTNTAGIGIELPTKTVGQGVTIPSQGAMGGRTCYSSDSVANMFVNVATGVTTSLAETNQDTDELHVYHLGNSDCDESNIVWSNKDVQLGCVVMVPSLECTNMVRRGRYLSEFDTDTDAMQDRHRSLKEHVANMIVGAAAGGQHGTTIDRNNRNLEDGKIYYTFALPTGTCTDSEEVLYKFKKWPAQTCARISTMNTENMEKTCKKNTTNPKRGKVYELCQKTCATVGLGPCKGSFVEATPDCKERVADLVAIIAAETSPAGTSDKVRQEIEEEEEFEKDEATNFDYANFYITIKNRPIVDTGISLTSTAKCSDSGSSPQYGGDCSRTPTYCPSTVGDLEGRKARLLGEIEMIESDIKQIDSEKDYLEQFQNKGLDSENNSVDCRCDASLSSSSPILPSWKQVCSGGCSATDSCLNLDFVCSPSAPICELNCSGRNSCNGLTMYCGDNQACAIKCSPHWTSCVGAKVVYNGMEFGEEQEWKSPPAEESRYFRFN